MCFWIDAPNVLGGRDLKCGGTWFGINGQGHFGLITNFREIGRTDPQATSRGQIVKCFLTQNSKPLEFIETVLTNAGSYNGFSLILGTPDEVHYYSNRRRGRKSLLSGVYGLSNGDLDVPWPKVEKAKLKLRSLQTSIIPTSVALLDLLHDESRPPDNQLPDTGVGIELERMLSPMFIRGDGYGTRVTTALVASKAGNISVSEPTYHAGEGGHSDRHFSFDIEVD